MNEDYKKRVALKILANVNPDNVKKIYSIEYELFKFNHSDEVTINGKVYGNSPEDKMTRFLMSLNDKNGNPNIKTYSACNTKGGFALNELFFIDEQLSNLEGIVFDKFLQKKQLEFYLNFLKARKKELEPITEKEEVYNVNEPTRNLDKLIWKYEAFWVNLPKNRILENKEIIKNFNQLSLSNEPHLSHRAIQEVKRLLNNPNFKVIITKYLNDAKELLSKIEVVINKNYFEIYDTLYLKGCLHLSTFINSVKQYLPDENLKNTNEKPKDEVTENEIVSQIEHPFSSPRNFDLFKYLDEWFKPTAKKSKYTYIYNHFKDNDFEPLLSQNTYLEFVKKFKNIEMANRLQGAPSNKFDAEINRLVSIFEKLNS